MSPKAVGLLIASVLSFGALASPCGGATGGGETRLESKLAADSGAYAVSFPSGTSIDAAVQAVWKQLPTNTRAGALIVEQDCALMKVTSPTLDAWLEKHQIGGTGPREWIALEFNNSTETRPTRFTIHQTSTAQSWPPGPPTLRRQNAELSTPRVAIRA